MAVGCYQLFTWQQTPRKFVLTKRTTIFFVPNLAKPWKLFERVHASTRFLYPWQTHDSPSGIKCEPQCAVFPEKCLGPHLGWKHPSFVRRGVISSRSTCITHPATLLDLLSPTTTERRLMRAFVSSRFHRSQPSLRIHLLWSFAPLVSWREGLLHDVSSLLKVLENYVNRSGTTFCLHNYDEAFYSGSSDAEP